MRAFTVTSLLAVVLLGVAAAAAGAATRTTMPSLYVSIHVTLTDSKVVLSPRSEPRGAIARFIIENTGTRAVTFNVGDERADRTKGFGFTEVVAPGRHLVRLLYLARRGPLPFFAGASYSGAKAAQRGQLVVGATCAACAPPGVMPSP